MINFIQNVRNHKCEEWARARTNVLGLVHRQLKYRRTIEGWKILPEWKYELEPPDWSITVSTSRNKNRLILYWVPVHLGITSNRKAYESARHESSTTCFETALEIPKSLVKNQSRHWINNKHKEFFFLRCLILMDVIFSHLILFVAALKSAMKAIMSIVTNA